MTYPNLFSTRSTSLVVGDLHGDEDAIRLIFELAVSYGAVRILQLGDFGYYPKLPKFKSFLSQFSAASVRTGIPVFFVDGNHDDHEALDHSVCRTQFVEVEPSIYWCPRGHQWSWDDVRFASLGGGYSVDRHRRRIGLDCHPDLECINRSDYDRLLDHSCDVLLAHDGPDVVPFPLKYDYPDDTNNRKVLTAVLTALSPTAMLHGHHHLWHVTGCDSTVVVGHGCAKDDMFSLLTTAYGNVHLDRIVFTLEGHRTAIVI